MFSLPVNKIKRITNDNRMDVEEYSEMYRDKCFYSNKQAEFLRYDKKSINKFEEILAAQEKAPTSKDG
ncbi:hypothetical protein CBG25_08060 [Arsenophonus sp. ENCA]|uniref:hypothetical protein n=1 Tax=Arsenophonus sp. ENCA TaxID=1987579 RepID=UPI000BD18943|nr:hypothetical protein [Arsenophonus sp. ENCA]PAV03371.1 hypothetical protein CBG25_08060 [Arsenophonus sp. ENCA]